MTRADALRALLAKVEAGTASGDDFMFAPRIGAPAEVEHYAHRAFYGSLDAAKALHEAVLPGAWADIRLSGQYGHCTVDVDGDEFTANNQPNPARAWLITILKALIATEDN